MIRRPRIGCAGWHYRSWRDRFYPAGWSPGVGLEHYANVFDTVEVNNTFYRLPPPETFASWRQQTPRSFLIAVKASRFMTHLKRLKEPQDPLHRFFASASALGSKLGPVSYQLPAHIHRDLERLATFVRPFRVMQRQDGAS